VADASTRTCNPQDASSGVRHVECPDQFAHAGRIDVGKPHQIQHNSPLATAKERLDPMAQFAVHRRSQRSLNFQD
jgi:hypothetical protein